MRIGIVSDAHGNAYALDKCLAALTKSSINEIVHLGDAVGYFPDADAVFKSLDSVGALSLLGNHEAMLLGLLKLDDAKDEAYRLRECRSKMSETRLKEISRWLPFHSRAIDGRKLLFVHGSPWDPLNGYIYPDSDLKPLFSLGFDAVFMGNTHLPFESKVDGLLAVNVGSCGLPRDHGNLLSWAIYDTSTGACQIVRHEVNVTEIMEMYGDRVSRIVVDCLNRK